MAVPRPHLRRWKFLDRSRSKPGRRRRKKSNQQGRRTVKSSAGVALKNRDRAQNLLLHRRFRTKTPDAMQIADRPGGNEITAPHQCGRASVNRNRPKLGKRKRDIISAAGVVEAVGD